MKLENKLCDLVSKQILTGFALEKVSEDGVVGAESKFRNTERLTLDFPNDEKLVIGTFCSGCAEDTCFVLEG